MKKKNMFITYFLIIIAIFSLFFVFKNIAKKKQVKVSKKKIKTIYKVNKVQKDTSLDTNLNGYGNTIGNIANFGIFAKSEGFLYFSRPSVKPGLYKIKYDPSLNIKNLKIDSAQIISNDTAYYINISGDFIYYRNVGDGGKLYKIKKDGTQRTKLNDDNSFYVNLRDDWIYYQNASNGRFLYKIKTDGTERTQLNDNYTSYIAAVDGWIYYQNETCGSVLYKIKEDGSQNTKLNDDVSVYLNVDNGWIFYTNRSDNQSLYKIKEDGSQRTKIYSGSTFHLNIDNGYIYSSDNKSKNFFRIKEDGTDKKMLNTDPSIKIDEFNFAGNYIFYDEDVNENPVDCGFLKKDTF